VELPHCEFRAIDRYDRDHSGFKGSIDGEN
jgi:hypothetical protein